MGRANGPGQRRDASVVEGIGEEARIAGVGGLSDRTAASQIVMPGQKRKRVARMRAR